jgi:hypothetical protein
MDSHIELVDGVYHRVKAPFFATMEYVGSMIGSNEKSIESVTQSVQL